MPRSNKFQSATILKKRMSAVQHQDSDGNFKNSYRDYAHGRFVEEKITYVELDSLPALMSEDTWDKYLVFDMREEQIKGVYFFDLFRGSFLDVLAYSKGEHSAIFPPTAYGLVTVDDVIDYIKGGMEVEE